MNLKKLFIDVKNNYKKEEFKDSKIASAIRKEPQGLIDHEIFDGERYIVKGSAGQGNWAGIPWILISDKKISKSAQEGIYIVYLFDSTQENVYLCLGTGWTFFKDKYKTVDKALENINKFVMHIRSNNTPLNSNSSFTQSTIDLDPKNDLEETGLAKGYMAGTIYSKKYEINDELSNEDLLKDLEEVKVIYEKTIKRFKIKNLESYTALVEDIIGK